MRGAWQRWVTLLSTREPGTTLAAFRAAVGVVLVVWVLTTVLSGAARVVWIDALHGGYRSLGQGSWLVDLLGGPTPGVVWPLVAVTIASGCCVAAGLGGRVAPLVALQCFRALYTIDREAIGSDDSLICNALWLLVLGRSTATLSLDCRIATGRFSRDVEIPAWPRYLAIFQLVVVYTASGLSKLSAPWTPAGGYSALYFALTEPTWRRFDMAWTAWVYPLTQIATAVTWHWETAAPLLLLVYWFRATPDRPGRLRALFNRRDLRIPWAAVGVGLHLGILAAFNVGAFSWISLSFYLCLWHPDELSRWVGGRRDAGAPPHSSGGGPEARAT